MVKEEGEVFEKDVFVYIVRIQEGYLNGQLHKLIINRRLL
jgi:hypothetical protein